MAFPTARQPAKPAAPKEASQANKDQERAEQLYNELHPGAVQAYFAYFSARTPPELREEMEPLVQAGVPQPPAENQVLLTSDEEVRVTIDGGGDAPGSPGRASIVNGHLDFVQLGPVTEP